MIKSIFRMRSSKPLWVFYLYIIHIYVLTRHISQYFLYQRLYLQFNFMVFDLSQRHTRIYDSTQRTRKTFMRGVLYIMNFYCINTKEYHKTSWRHENFQNVHATKVNGKYLSRRLVMIFIFFIFFFEHIETEQYVYT